MKKSLIILSGFAVSIMLSGCSHFLNTIPTDFASPENYYNNEVELTRALTGVYSTLNHDASFGRNLPVELAHGSDEAFHKRSAVTVTPMVYNHDPANTIVQNVWSRLYSGINEANLLLANIHRPEMDEGVRNRVRGETLFLRAFFYFQLLHHWGGVPIHLEPTTSGESVNYPRASEAEVYDLIMRDMKEAEALVPHISAYNHSGRITKTAVWGMLARVCLKMAGQPFNDVSKFAEAKEWAAKVITSDQHRLNPDYAQIFRNHTRDIYETGENIWEIEFSGNSIESPALMGGRFAKQFSIRNTSEALYGYATLGATAVLYRKYDDPHDVRRNRNIATFYYSPASSGNPGDTTQFESNAIYDRDAGKWRVYEELLAPKNRDRGPSNYPVLRYADVLLMLCRSCKRSKRWSYRQCLLGTE